MKECFEKLYSKGEYEYYKRLSKILDKNQKIHIITANPEIFRMSIDNNIIKKMLLKKDKDVIPDGIAVVKASKHYKINIKERITGIDTTYNLLKLLNQKNKSLYLFGAKEEVLNKLVTKIKEEYPRIRIVGQSNGYVRNKDEVFEEIIKLSPDVCLVALGVPEQELLIDKYFEKVKKGIYVGVGGSFDVLSGQKKRAPKIFIKLNLEWLYRLIKEPYRIKRFYKNNIMFVLKVLFDKNK